MTNYVLGKWIVEEQQNVIMRKGFSKYVVKSNAELEKRNRVIRNQKDLIKQMQEEGKVKVEVTRANEDIDFPKG